MLNKWMGIVPNASEHGYLIDHTLEVCHWFMLFLFVGWFSFFLYTIFRFHKSRNPVANYHGVKSKASAHLEFVVVVVEAVLLMGFGIPLWNKRTTEESFPDKGEALRVHAVGEQFGWWFHYAGPDGKFARQDLHLVSSSNPLGIDWEDPTSKDDYLSRNELHLINYKPTVIEITSKDVIHSFALHSMRITQDATPGMRVPMWFRPKVEGTYEIVCAQLCGSGHYAMKASMIVEDQKAFDAWEKETTGLNHPAKAAAIPAAPTATLAASL
jgi:cytochrome c oxidase subunit 2